MFKKKRKDKSKVAKSISELRKNKTSILGYTPTDYVYTPEFEKVMAHRDAWAKDQIKGITLNEYSSSVIDPKVDAMVIFEIAHAKAQKVNHCSVIKDLSNMIDSESYNAIEVLACLEEDLTKDKETLAILESLKKSIDDINIKR